MIGSSVAASLTLVSVACAATVKVDPHTTYQQYDGTGCSEAFQRSLLVYNLSEEARTSVLDYLFTEKGAGFTILRNGIGSTPNQPFDYMKSIAPEAPASNDSELNYIPLPRDDQYQVWLSHEAKARGVHTIYADSWSADGYMKTNNTDFYGGYLCGVYNTSCASGDWRQAYADKLTRYIQDYADEGIHIDYLGFVNEPDIATSYASMEADGRQLADFIDVLRPTLDAAGITTEIACCDGTGWQPTRERIADIQSLGQEQNLGLVTSHGYSDYPSAPFDTDLKTWQTEWSTFDDLNANWYTPGGSQSDGIRWANNIHQTFAVSNVTGFLYWWGAAEKNDTNEMLIYINNTSDEVRPLKRLWAHAHFGKQFIRQGAVRIDAVSSTSTLNVTAFANTDGTAAVQVINNSNSTEYVELQLPIHGHRKVETYLTNQQYDLKAGHAHVKGGRWGGWHHWGGWGGGKKTAVAQIPGQSLLSFYVCD